MIMKREYFRRCYDMHWTDRYTANELAEMDAKNMKEARKRSYQTNIVEIIQELETRIKSLEEAVYNADASRV